MPKMIKKRQSLENKSVSMTFDIEMLDALIKYVRCEWVLQPQVSVLYKLITQLNFDEYKYNPDILDRLKLLKVVSKGISEDRITDESVLKMFIRENLEDAEDILGKVNFEKNQLSQSDCEIMHKAVNERLQYLYIYQVKDDIVHSLNDFDNVGFTSYYDIINEIKIKLSNLLTKLQNVSAPDELIRSFNFSGEEYLELLTKIVTKAKKPSTILQSGIRQLNALLSPGFQSGELYLFLGGTGRFKSGTLWNIADQLRQFNPHVKPVEDGMRKVILFITLENTIYETIIRLFDMYNPTQKEIKELSVEEVAEILRENGKFVFSSEDGIDIEMRYYSDLEINCSDIRVLIHDLRNQGKKVIALILDYILKLDSIKEHYGDEKTRLSYAGRELRSVAQEFDIPVITAMQINREGNGILESSMQENKEDIGRFIGNQYVGQCWDLIQEATWVCFVNLEMQKSTGKWFLSFKRTKIRGKKDLTAADYFNHPFSNDNGIRLEPDVNKPEPISVISLASDLVNIDDSNMEYNGKKRPKVSDVVNQGRKSIKKFEEISLDGLIKAS